MRGYQLLSQADVLVYDALIDPELLQQVPQHCEKLDVSKRGGTFSTPQAKINHLLVMYCQQGQQVVRLKSGDPFIFGRCTAEIEALMQAGCSFEVVPGISSALAAPLFASIPLTDPVLSRCFTVLSAHEPETLDWQTLSRIDTLVILMGAKSLSLIVEQLQRHGRSPQTPIALIRWAGQPQQQIWIGCLSSIVQQTRSQSLSPCVIVIGEVVGLRSYLGGQRVEGKSSSPPALSLSSPPPMLSPSLPLTGKTILVTRSAGQSSQFTLLLEQQGATVIEMPTLEITPPSSWQPLDQAIARLDQFDWLILTSANGVDYFFKRLAVQGKDARALAGVKLAVVGRKTAASLQQQGLQPDFIPPDFVADSLVEHFPERDRLSALKILFPRVETGGRDVLVRELTNQGATVVEVPAYESGCARKIPPDVMHALQNHPIDFLTFASSKTVKCFHQLLEGVSNQATTLLSLPLPASIAIASIGPQTSATCQELLGRVDVEAKDYTLEGLIQAIVKWVSEVDGQNG
jgi:uroporphyrinogen III methyltransferase/synthase